MVHYGRVWKSHSTLGYSQRPPRAVLLCADPDNVYCNVASQWHRGRRLLMCVCVWYLRLSVCVKSLVVPNIVFSALTLLIGYRPAIPKVHCSESLFSLQLYAIELGLSAIVNFCSSGPESSIGVRKVIQPGQNVLQQLTTVSFGDIQGWCCRHKPITIVMPMLHIPF